MNLFISPIDKEVSWDKNMELVSKTDQNGTIKYCNENFVNISGYEEHELVGKPHNIIRHPDMPKVIFKILWDHILNGEDFHAVVKNMAKSGRYYWVITQFEIIKNSNGVITGYIGRRKSVSENVARTLEKLYIKLKKIEEQVNVEAAEDYFNGYLDDQKKTYQEFLNDILEDDMLMKQIEENSRQTLNSNQELIQESKTRKSFLRSLFGG
jgi:PAS domain S-box-containing protein